MIKAVVQAILTYVMSVFKLPKTLCDCINSIMSRFWWSSHQNDKRVAWMSWENMGTAKYVGEMGFRELEVFNLALLAKQGWQILQNPESLVARVYK